MNRKLLILIVLGAATAGSIGVGQSSGQPGPPDGTSPGGANAVQRVAVLDLVRIFNDCGQIKDLNQDIGNKTEEITKEAEQRRRTIETARDELAAFQPGTPDYETRRKVLVRLNVDANVWFKMQEEEIERQKFYWTRIIYERTMQAAAEIARDRGYDVVLQRMDFKPFEIEQSVPALRRLLQERTVVYNVPEVDITELVIRHLDAGYKAGGGKKQLGGSALPGP